jgi:hypothetical protein
MSESTTPIDQILKNYITNLPSFPPQPTEVRPFYDFMRAFYANFGGAAQALDIRPELQPDLLDAAQKLLWAFGQSSAPFPGGLELPAPVLLKTARPASPTRLDETIRLLNTLSLHIDLLSQDEWIPSSHLSLRGTPKQSPAPTAVRLSFDPPALAESLARLVALVTAGNAKEKAAYERFLRADPGAVLAREKPPLALAPDAPEILANLPASAADAWRELSRHLSAAAKPNPEVEFRSIHHGMWVVNFAAKRGGKDLAGLIVQNGRMTVRIVLHGAMHFKVGEHLDEFGDPVRNEYHAAHWYEEFQHKWLFIPCASPQDTVGIKLLIDMLTP